MTKDTSEDEGTAGGLLWPPRLDEHVGTLGIEYENIGWGQMDDPMTARQ